MLSWNFDLLMSVVPCEQKLHSFLTRHTVLKRTIPTNTRQTVEQHCCKASGFTLSTRSGHPQRPFQTMGRFRPFILELCVNWFESLIHLYPQLLRSHFGSLYNPSGRSLLRLSNIRLQDNQLWKDFQLTPPYRRTSHIALRTFLVDSRHSLVNGLSQWLTNDNAIFIRVVCFWHSTCRSRDFFMWWPILATGLFTSGIDFRKESTVCPCLAADFWYSTIWFQSLKALLTGPDMDCSSTSSVSSLARTFALFLEVTDASVTRKESTLIRSCWCFETFVSTPAVSSFVLSRPLIIHRRAIVNSGEL